MAACCTSEPTEGEPVKNRWSKGSLENVAETSEPPVTMPSSAGSKYVGDVDFIRSEVRGVISDILIITRLPAANAADAGNTIVRALAAPRQVDHLTRYVLMIQSNSAVPIGHHFVQHFRAKVRRDHDAVGMPLNQPARRQAAAAKTEPIPALRHPDHRVDERTWSEAPADQAGEFLAESHHGEDRCAACHPFREVGDDLPLRTRLTHRGDGTRSPRTADGPFPGEAR